MKKIVTLLTLWSIVVTAIAQNKETPVLVGSVEGIKQYRLSNGLEILLLPDASQSNVVTNIVYKVGSRHEGYGETGMAHLLEHMLFKSTKKLGDIKKMLSEKGGNANGTTWLDRTNYYEVFPASDDNLRWSIEMEADRMINATILQSDLDKEFSVVRNEFEIGENDPGKILMERIVSTGFLWHNYGNSTIGSREDIERVKADRLRVFYEKYYQPDNAVLMVGGKFDEAKALEYISTYFSVILKPSRILYPTYTVEPPQDGERFVELKRVGDVQHVAAMYHTCAFADEDFVALDALVEILTADPSGYLHKSLVQSGIASSIYAWQPNLRDPSYMYFNIDVEKSKDIEKAKTSFLSELDNIASKSYTQTDIDRAKTKVLKSWEDGSNNTINLTILLTEVIGAGDFRLWYMYRDRAEKLTLADIQRVAKKYFKSNNRTWGMFKPGVNEERVKTTEISDDKIAVLIKDYKGKTNGEATASFDATISNIKKATTKKQLNNGFTFSLLNKPIKGKKVLMKFVMKTGNETELMNQSMIGSFAADMLLGGSEKLSKEQIMDQFDKLKSSVSVSWSGQSFIISISSYEDQIKDVMKLLKSCLVEANFPVSEFEKLKSEYKSAIEQQLSDPQSLAFNALELKTSNYPKGHMMYASSPKEQLEELAKVSLDQVKSFYKKFAGANHGYGSIIGMIAMADAEFMMNEVFGNWNSAAPYKKFVATYNETKSSVEKIETPDKENGVLASGLHVNMNRMHSDYPALIMANEIMGSGGFLTSRIPTRLREKEGISYGAGSYIDIPREGNAGAVGIYAFFNPKEQERVDYALNEEIQKLINEGVTEEEIKKCFGSWKNERNTNLGNDGYLLELLNASMDSNYPLEWFDELEKKVGALTLKQVNDALKKYVLTSALVKVYAGDFRKK